VEGTGIGRTEEPGTGGADGPATGVRGLALKKLVNLEVDFEFRSLSFFL
jgi:hypothetical protein